MPPHQPTSGEIHVTKNSISMRMLPGLLLGSLCIAGATHAAPQAVPTRAVLPIDDSAWRSGPPGLPGGSTFAVISGDPAQAGPFTIRVELPSGYRLESYRRPREENVIVLVGAIQVGARTLPSGSFVRLRANEWHSLSTQSGATLQIFGDGPFALSSSDSSSPRHDAQVAHDAAIQ
jgi:hypothetical protein